ncbi:hypothetical protein MMC18_001848 [Xylographa bjoerkii]|nr:hypothetical protein [Xylographa bjoerkii]
MSQVSSYVATPLLIVCVCVLRCVLTARQALFCLERVFPEGLDYLEEDDVECIWSLAKDSYPIFIENMSVWKLDGSRDDASSFILSQGLKERMSPQMIERLSGLEPTEETLEETFLTLRAAARVRP